jgi:HD-like signal output (HDOD) protein
MLNQLQASLNLAAVELKDLGSSHAGRTISERITALAEAAEAAGAWGVVESLGELGALVNEDKWSGFDSGLEQLQFAARLIHQHLNPNAVPVEYLSSHEQNAAQDEQARAVWINAPREGRCPVVNWGQLQRELDALPGCPVIDSAAAAFQMAATGHPSSLNPVMDLVENDPGLAAQLLIAANQLKHSDDSDEGLLEDPRLAVGRLGEQRLAAQAGALVTAEERHMQIPPILDWTRFWKFQTGVARMARFTCRYLELYSMEPTASMAGLLHDLGKLLLLRLHPLALQGIIEHSRQCQLPLPEVERQFLGCTTAEMAAYFAERHGLPRRYANVMRWIGAPGEATDDAVLVAVVSLARDLCRQNNVGASGDVRQHRAVPLEETAEWPILSGSVFPSFNLRRFELQVHADCRELKLELHGRLAAHNAA